MTVNKQSLSEDELKDIKKVAKGAGTTFIGSVIGRCLWFACQVIIARYFGAEVFGLYVLGLIVLKITELLSRFGLHAGAMRFVSIYRIDYPGKVKGTIISATLISFIVGIFLGGIVYLSAGFISESLFHNQGLSDIVKTFALCVPFMATMTVVSSASRGFHTTKYFVFIKHIVQNLVNLVLIILFILLGFGIFWVINAYIISHAIALLVGIYFIAKQFPGIKDRALKPVYEIKRLLSYSIPLLLNGFLQFLLLWTATIMLGYMSSPADAGIFRAASQIPALLIIILTANQSIYAPAVAEMYHLEQMERLEKIFKTTTRWIFFIVLPLTIVIIFSASELMAIFGSEYIVAGPNILVVLAIAQFINCVTGGVIPTLNMTGKQHIEMSNSFFMIIINIVLNYFLIPRYGTLGAAIATAVSIGTINLIRLLEVYIIYKIHPYNKDYIPGIACGVIIVVVLYFLGKHLPDHFCIVRLITSTFVVGVSFVLPLIVKGTCADDRILFDAVAKRFKLKTSLKKS